VGGRNREAGLAHAGQPDERDHADGTEQRVKLGEIGRAADKLHRRRQRAGTGLNAARGHRGGDKRLPGSTGQTQRIREQVHRAALRPTYPPPLQLTYGSYAESGSGGQFLLGKAGRPALGVQRRGEAYALRTVVPVRERGHGLED
jgi:hypothetical protein